MTVSRSPCLPIFVTEMPARADNVMFVVLRKHNTLWQEYSLIAPVTTLSAYLSDEAAVLPDIGKNDFFNASLLGEHKNIFKINNQEPVTIDFTRVTCIDFASIDQRRLNYKNAGHIAGEEFGRIQTLTNNHLEECRYNGYWEYLDRVWTAMEACYSINSFWQRMYKEQVTPKHQVNQELNDGERLRKKVQKFMDQNVPLSKAIDLAKFGDDGARDDCKSVRKDGAAKTVAPEADVPLLAAVAAGPLQHCLDRPFREALSAGLFDSKQDDALDARFFLNSPLYDDSQVTLRDLYQSVADDKFALVKKYKFVGPKTSSRIADRIIGAFDAAQTALHI